MMDCRQNLLTTLNNLIKKVNFFQTRPEDKNISRFINALTSELQLLRNDLVLVFNQNFYLRCKLQEKTQELQASQKKLTQVTQRMNLTLEMTKQKYEKQIQSIKFNHFVHKEPCQEYHKGDLYQNSSEILLKKNANPIRYNKQQKVQQSTHQSSTIKKNKEFIEPKPTPSKECVFLGQTSEKRQNFEHFDLQVRGGILSEEKTLFSNNRVNQEMVRSNEMQEQHSKKRRGKTANVRKEEGQASHRKKKSQELAQLVAQQFKVMPMKEKYFSTDLL